MGQFDTLTKYIPLIDNDEIGHWQIDRENDGTSEHPIQFPFVAFSEMVNHFIDDVYALVDRYPEWELNHYGQILEDNGLQWGTDSMSNAIVENLDTRCICALFVGAVRAERFCDGALLSFFKNGSISRWLQRLKEIDKAQSVPLKRIQITSNGVCYGPSPAPDEEVEQRLVLYNDGRVWFTGYNFGYGIKYTQSRRKQFKIPKEKISKLFEAFEKYFSSEPLLIQVCDASSWGLKLTDTNGKTTKFQGPMVGSYEIDGINLSTLAREVLPIENLWVFSRSYINE